MLSLEDYKKIFKQFSEREDLRIVRAFEGEYLEVEALTVEAAQMLQRRGFDIWGGFYHKYFWC